MLTVNNMSVSVGSFSLKDISFTVRASENFVILGPSGAGKTILIESLLGIHKINSGKIVVDGVDVTGMPPEDRMITYLPQDVALFPHLSVMENILFGVRARDIPGADYEKRLGDLLEILDLKKVQHRKSVSGLSGGEKQRVGLLRALLAEPPLIFLDEPFSAIDSFTKKDLLLMLAGAKKKTHSSFVFVMHDREEALFLADSVLVLIDGKVEQCGPCKSILRNPSSIKVARYLLHRNIFEGVVGVRNGNNATVIKTGPADFLARDLDLDEGQRVYFGIRPEEVIVIRPDKPLGAPVKYNVFSGTIRKIFSYGGERTIIIDSHAFPNPVEIQVPAFALRDLSMEEGGKIEFSLKKNAIWVIRSNGSRSGNDYPV